MKLMKECLITGANRSITVSLPIGGLLGSLQVIIHLLFYVTLYNFVNRGTMAFLELMLMNVLRTYLLN